MEEPVQLSSQTSLDSPEHPPSLRLGVLPPFSNIPSPSRSPDSYLPTPEASVSSTDDDTAVVGSLQQQHARNASYAGGSRGASRSALAGKKSLPDLRTARLNFGAVKNPPNLPTRGYTTESPNGNLRTVSLCLRPCHSERTRVPLTDAPSFVPPNLSHGSLS